MEEQKNLQEETSLPFDARKLWFLQEVFREYAVLFGEIADSHDFLIGKSLKHITNYSSKNMQIDIKQGLKVLRKQVKRENRAERKALRKIKRHQRYIRIREAFQKAFNKIFRAHGKSASNTACRVPDELELTQEENNEYLDRTNC